MGVHGGVALVKGADAVLVGAVGLGDPVDHPDAKVVELADRNPTGPLLVGLQARIFPLPL